MTTKNWLGLLAVTLFPLGITSCGGGGSEGPSPTPPPPSGSSNTAPIAALTSEKSLVTMSQAFSLDASGSRDADGDTLGYSWTQTAGPSALTGSESGAVVTLTAPDVSTRQQLTFEVAVSDGRANSTQSVSLSVDPLLPVMTAPSPSPVFSNMNVIDVAGLWPNDTGYRIYWKDGFTGGQTRAIVYQDYSFEGEPVGEQVEAEIQGGANDRIRISEVLENGPTVFNLTSNRPSPDGGTYTNRYTYDLGFMTQALSGTNIYAASEFLTFKNQFGSDLPDRDNIVGHSESDKMQYLLFSDEGNEATRDEEKRIVLYTLSADGTHVSQRLDSGTALSLGGGRIGRLGPDATLVSWQENTADGSTVFIRRVPDTGGAGDAIPMPFSSDETTPFLNFGTFENGNALITWVKTVGRGTAADQTLRGRILRPDGTYESDAIDILSRQNGLSQFQMVPLEGGMLVVFTRRSEIRAVFVDEDGNASPNTFKLGDKDSILSIPIHTANLGEGRVVVSWAPETDGETYTVSFHPDGRP